MEWKIERKEEYLIKDRVEDRQRGRQTEGHKDRKKYRQEGR
jgi:hypothetical protein